MINNKIKKCFKDFFQADKEVKDFNISMRKKNELMYHFYLDDYNESLIPVIGFKHIYKFKICHHNIKVNVLYSFAFVNNKWQGSVEAYPQNKNIKTPILDFFIMKEIKKEKRIINISNIEKFSIKQSDLSFSILFEFDCFNIELESNLELSLSSEAFNRYVKEKVFDKFNIKINNKEIKKIESIFLPLLLRGDENILNNEIQKFKINKSNKITFNKEDLEYFELLYSS